MSKLRVLVLTDHRGHSESNSVYDLGAALCADERVASVDVASRGLPDNFPFFYRLQAVKIRVHRISASFDFATGRRIFRQTGRWRSVADYHLIWLRLPRPIPLGFFDFLEQRFPGQLLLNRPSGILLSSNKTFLLRVSDICPPVRHCSTLADILDFQKQFPIVLKPVEDFGGRGILRVENGQILLDDGPVEITQYRDELNRQFKLGGYLAMKYLRNVGQGDKRIVVVNGEVIGAVLRLPPPGSWICNASRGGQAQLAQADADEVAMAKRLHEELAALGIAMFGMDTLVNDQGKRTLSEVNTLSIGGIKPLGDLSGEPAAARVVRRFLDFALEQTVDN